MIINIFGVVLNPDSITRICDNYGDHESYCNQDRSSRIYFTSLGYEYIKNKTKQEVADEINRLIKEKI